ncbi:nuclear transport factor 2 family protein [Spirosoma sp. KNUC1025]|uniref:nuclear transport factor 2 family protein n=1 Tax=Spirosoma sp. KNUC1025 TaxID=2894082 RepID=UPI00386BC988|nr:nuclear transport factor 2 family protein [Spirosoma sp. KNUC1025]
MKSLLTVCLLVTFQLVRAQAPTSPSAGAIVSTPERMASLSVDEKAVLAVEKQRFDAQIKKDYAVLDRVLADDLIYTHSNANTDNKQSYIQSIREGKSKYDAISIEEQKVRVYGNTAVINGTCMIKAMNNGETINTHVKYTDVYVRNGSQWQMVAWQSIRLAK